MLLYFQDTDRVFRKVFVYAPPSAGPAVQTMLKVRLHWFGITCLLVYGVAELQSAKRTNGCTASCFGGNGDG